MRKSSGNLVEIERNAGSGSANCAGADRRSPSALQEIGGDDRYPGSFFRVPGLPQPGKTTWSLAK